MDVDEDSGVGVFVDAREEHSRWGGGAAAGDGDLVAGGVELGLVEGAGGVQGDDFGAQEVVAGGDVGGDFHVDWEGMASVYLGGDGFGWSRDVFGCIPRPQQFSMSLTPHQSLSPCKSSQRLGRFRIQGREEETHSTVVRWTPRIREHLEERRRPIRRPRIRHLAHVNIHRSPVRSSNRRRLQRRESARPVACLLVHFDSDGVTSFDSAAPCDSAPVYVAANVIRGNILKGVV